MIIAVGSETKIPPIDGIDTIRTWSNKDATGARDLPASLLVLGGGPTGVELAQVYARFGVPVTVIQSGPRLIPSDAPRNSEAALKALVRDGVDVRLGVRAVRAVAASAPGEPDVVHLDDGTTASGHATLAGGRQDLPARTRSGSTASGSMWPIAARSSATGDSDWPMGST